MREDQSSLKTKRRSVHQKNVYKIERLTCILKKRYALFLFTNPAKGHGFGCPLNPTDGRCILNYGFQFSSRQIKKCLLIESDKSGMSKTGWFQNYCM